MKKKITILGAGESGVGAALLAKSKGEDVFVSDKGAIQEKYVQILENNYINYEKGGHHENHILASDLVIKSPGIPEKNALIRKLRNKNIPVISEIEYASWHSRAKFIAITGSNGKTTTSLLTYHLLRSLGLNVGLAGNVGESLAKQVLEDKYDYYVLELSSFQLDDVYKFKADIAVLLNITPDHLDRYEYDFEKYKDSKFRVIRNMDTENYFIAFSDDPVINKELKNSSIDVPLLEISLRKEVQRGAWWDGTNINFNVHSKSFSFNPADFSLKGKHNLVNIMAASLVAAILTNEMAAIKEHITTFKNAPHRLEPCGEINGVKFINDSKATNVDSVFYALDSFSAPLIWIAGGVDKGNDYSSIESLVKIQVKKLVCLGKDNAKLHTSFAGIVDELVDCSAMNDAVLQAFSGAKPGDVVLLSPACASFDLFKNYEDRGEQFKACVQQLIEQEKIPKL